MKYDHNFLGLQNSNNYYVNYKEGLELHDFRVKTSRKNFYLLK